MVRHEEEKEMFKDELVKALQSEKGEEIANLIVEINLCEENMDTTCPNGLGLKQVDNCFIDNTWKKRCRECWENATFED